MPREWAGLVLQVGTPAHGAGVEDRAVPTGHLLTDEVAVQPLGEGHGVSDPVALCPLDHHTVGEPVDRRGYEDRSSMIGGGDGYESFDGSEAELRELAEDARIVVRPSDVGLPSAISPERQRTACSTAVAPGQPARIDLRDLLITARPLRPRATHPARACRRLRAALAVRQGHEDCGVTSSGQPVGRDGLVDPAEVSLGRGQVAHPSRLSAADTSVRTPGRSTERSGANRGLWFPGTLPSFSARSAPGAASHTAGGVDVTYQ
ncbi:hypothetical protein SBADM41S_09252 [Streptomyces badius]